MIPSSLPPPTSAPTVHRWRLALALPALMFAMHWASTAWFLGAYGGAALSGLLAVGLLGVSLRSLSAVLGEPRSAPYPPREAFFGVFAPFLVGFGLMAAYLWRAWENVGFLSQFTTVINGLPDVGRTMHRTAQAVLPDYVARLLVGEVAVVLGSVVVGLACAVAAWALGRNAPRWVRSVGQACPVAFLAAAGACSGLCDAVFYRTTNEYLQREPSVPVTLAALLAENRRMLLPGLPSVVGAPQS